MSHSLYERAQIGVAQVKSAIFELLEQNKDCLTNAEIGRSLGIYFGHEGHEGHIPRSLISLMEREGAVYQDGPCGKWFISKGV